MAVVLARGRIWFVLTSLKNAGHYIAIYCSKERTVRYVIPKISFPMCDVLLVSVYVCDGTERQRRVVTEFSRCAAVWFHVTALMVPGLTSVASRAGKEADRQEKRPILRGAGEPQPHRRGQRLPGVPLPRGEAAARRAHHQPAGGGKAVPWRGGGAGPAPGPRGPSASERRVPAACFPQEWGLRESLRL